MSEKVVKRRGEFVQSLVTQRVHGTNRVEHFRKTKQEMSPVFEHVQFNAHKVNEAPTRGNRGGWGYVGSIPLEIMFDWIRKNGYTYDQFARNEDSCKDKFKQWFLTSRETSKFRASNYHHRVGRVFGP